MKWLKNMCVGLLALSVMFMSSVRIVRAAEDEYTYTVRLYAGNLGILTETGVEVSPRSGSELSASIAASGSEIVIEGLKYGDTVYIRPQDAAKVTDERYFIRGVRRSGRDNSEAEAPAFDVACDRDYVVAYGVVGDKVSYRVDYVDTDGRTLMSSDTYYGNAGERQYVSSRYIDGYRPQALNMVKTLSSNEAENVFTFQYDQITVSGSAAETGGETEGGGSTAPAPAPGTTPAAGTDAAAAGAGGAAGPAAGTVPAAGDGADAAGAGEDAPVGGDAAVQAPDEEVPLSGQESLRDLDDEEVPLADLRADQQGLMGYFPAYVGISLTALLVLIASAVYLKKKHKVSAEKES